MCGHIFIRVKVLSEIFGRTSSKSDLVRVAEVQFHCAGSVDRWVAEPKRGGRGNFVIAAKGDRADDHAVFFAAILFADRDGVVQARVAGLEADHAIQLIVEQNDRFGFF